MSKQQKSTERYLAKRQLLTTRRDECNKNIRDLGVLPEEAFEKYTNVKAERVGELAHLSIALICHYPSSPNGSVKSMSRLKSSRMSTRRPLSNTTTLLSRGTNYSPDVTI